MSRGGRRTDLERAGRSLSDPQAEVDLQAPGRTLDRDQEVAALFGNAKRIRGARRQGHRRLLTFCPRTPRHGTSQDRRRRLSRPLIRIQEATGWHQVTPDGTADAELENRKGPGSQPARACALVTSATARRHPGGIARATLFLASGAPNIDTGSATIVSVIYRCGLSDSNSSMTRAA